VGLVENIDKLIAKYHKQIELLAELRDMHLLAEAFGVDARLIVSSGYKAPTRDEYRRWPQEARKRLSWFSSFVPCDGDGHP
jgi:hypothetical protein